MDPYRCLVGVWCRNLFPVSVEQGLIHKTEWVPERIVDRILTSHRNN